MSDEPRKVGAQAVPQLLGIAALSAVLLAAIKSDRLPESKLSRLEQVARLLRADMTEPEAFVETEFVNDLFIFMGGTSRSRVTVFYEPRRREFLKLHFLRKHHPLTGRYEMLLVAWNVSRR